MNSFVSYFSLSVVHAIPSHINLFHFPTDLPMLYSEIGGPISKEQIFNNENQFFKTPK